MDKTEDDIDPDAKIDDLDELLLVLRDDVERNRNSASRRWHDAEESFQSGARPRRKYEDKIIVAKAEYFAYDTIWSQLDTLITERDELKKIKLMKKAQQAEALEQMVRAAGVELEELK